MILHKGEEGESTRFRSHIFVMSLCRALDDGNRSFSRKVEGKWKEMRSESGTWK